MAAFGVGVGVDVTERAGTGVGKTLGGLGWARRGASTGTDEIGHG